MMLDLVAATKHRLASCRHTQFSCFHGWSSHSRPEPLDLSRQFLVGQMPAGKLNWILERMSEKAGDNSLTVRCVCRPFNSSVHTYATLVSGSLCILPRSPLSRSSRSELVVDHWGLRCIPLPSPSPRHALPSAPSPPRISLPLHPTRLLPASASWSLWRGQLSFCLLNVLPGDA
jgi:hypothetical protein